jgi:hypothetical protein
MAITDEEFREFGKRTARPTPGQSLTNNPEAMAPYEKPPRFTNKKEALQHFFSLVTSEKKFMDIMDSLEEGVPVMDIVELILINSFQKGEINPDLMLLLAEPLAYILLGLAERQGIRAKITDDPDDPNIDEENLFRSKIQTITKPQDDEEVPMQEQIENVPSLMERRVQ